MSNPIRFNKIKLYGLIALIISLSLMMISCEGIFREAGGVTDAESSFVPESTLHTEEAIATTEAVVTEPEIVDPYKDVSITFTAAGDNLIHPNIYMEAATRATGGEEYDFTPMYSEIADIISAADFAFINQETLMAGEGFEISGYPSFNSPQKLGHDLTTLGFDIINIANNHMLDKSAAGLKATMDFWKTLPVTMIGAYYNDADAENIPTIEADGITIALLSYAHHTNGISAPAGTELNIPYVNDERIKTDLAKAKEISDFIIVSIHWGEENTSQPDDEQKRLAKLISDGGADVILGHHSHTLLPIEWIDRADGGRTLCAYSLGNLVSAMMYPENMAGGLLNFTVKSDGVGGLCLGDISFVPTVFYYGMNHFGTHIYRLENYDNNIASGHGTQMYGYTTTYEKVVSYFKRAIPEEYLPDYMKAQN